MFVLGVEEFLFLSEGVWFLFERIFVFLLGADLLQVEWSWYLEIVIEYDVG